MVDAALSELDSQWLRKWIEECFGWARVIGGMRKSRFVGREKLDFPFVLTMSAYNLVRMLNPGALGLQKRVSNASFR